MTGSPVLSVNCTNRKNPAKPNYHMSINKSQAILKCFIDLIDCEQPLSFFRFIWVKGSARARTLSGTWETRACLSRLAPSVTRVVICLSRAFCSTEARKRETARSLLISRIAFGSPWAQKTKPCFVTPSVKTFFQLDCQSRFSKH